ncbi:hypothetical protein MANES_15G176237v8 [Manihot esculenta]|uniref:Uncharacterized protein n=1 Tax=Manihot esculenta TaxID=3983 RepID=A0ACB7GD49_MANES|nr:hypothetical protein MANES_15G176237v8 [Manihot esculenta]
MHESNVVVVENSINELIEEVVNDEGHGEHVIDEVEEANETVLEVVEENGSHPQDLSMTNIFMPSSFVLDVHVVDETFMTKVLSYFHLFKRRSLKIHGFLKLPFLT